MNAHSSRSVVCSEAQPKTGIRRWILPAAGLLSLVWFLLRVVPKPSRAAYPCQRAAAPLAAGFAIWVGGALASVSLFRYGRMSWRRSRIVLACACVMAAAILAFGVVAGMPKPAAMAEPNEPLGIGRGIHPGRVVWVHDPRATNWNGPGDGHWWEDTRTLQPAVDRMMSDA